jgi:hypothetical protein
MGEMRNAYNILVEKLQRESTLRRSTCGWEVYIKMGLREIRLEGMNCISWLRTGSNGGFL